MFQRCSNKDRLQEIQLIKIKNTELKIIFKGVKNVK